MDTNVIKEKLRKEFNKHFKDSAIGFTTSALTGNLVVTITLGNGREEFQNGIIQNDPVHCATILENDDKNGYVFNFKPKVSALKPKDKYHAMSSERVRTRVIKGSAEKVVKRFGAVCKKLRDLIEEKYNNEEFLPLPYNPLDKLK